MENWVSPFFPTPPCECEDLCAPATSSACSSSVSTPCSLRLWASLTSKDATSTQRPRHVSLVAPRAKARRVQSHVYMAERLSLVASTKSGLLPLAFVCQFLVSCVVLWWKSKRVHALRNWFLIGVVCKLVEMMCRAMFAISHARGNTSMHTRILCENESKLFGFELRTVAPSNDTDALHLWCLYQRFNRSE